MQSLLIKQPSLFQAAFRKAKPDPPEKRHKFSFTQAGPAEEAVYSLGTRCLVIMTSFGNINFEFLGKGTVACITVIRHESK